ncbi:MAG TPA: FliH/SctL family protein, partial [Gemmata sp.]
NLHTEQAARLGELQQVAVAMAVTIATRLLHEQIESGTFAIENKVRDMIAQLGGDAAVTVRLNPADLALLTTRLGGQPLSDDYSDPRFVADPSLGRGDCQVEGRESMLLSDVTRELEDIRDDLLRRVKNARS